MYLFNKDYREYSPENCLIYCDPPYLGTTSYSTVFDSSEFWIVMREWSKSNTVIVSEYEAPSDFACVLRIPRITGIRATDGYPENRIEKLFRYSSLF